MRDFQNAMRQLAHQVGSDKLDLKIGIVTSADPATHAVKATLQPEGIDTGFRPYMTPIAGAGWGILCLPPAGTPVVFDHEGGDIDAAIAQGCIYDNDHMPPTGYQAGEIWLVHISGTAIKLTNDTNLTINAAGALNVTVNGATTINSTAPVNITAPTINLNP